MEDEDIARNTIPTADPVGMGRKLRQYTILQYSVQAQLSANTDWISCRYVFGAISSSSILCPHPPSSMLQPHTVDFELKYYPQEFEREKKSKYL